MVYRALIGTKFLSAALRVEDALGRGWVGGELRRGPDGARRKIATAVWATATEPVFYALTAKCAFVGADHGVVGGWRQGLVAAFTGGSQFEHVFILLYILIFTFIVRHGRRFR